MFYLDINSKRMVGILKHKSSNTVILKIYMYEFLEYVW